jgi:hypothetical protein
MSWTITGSEKNPVDIYRSNVSLLLHGDGTNGSTTIIDSSPSPKTVTAVGNAQISTAQSKFGGSSLAFDGSGDYVSIADSADFTFGSGNFTIEFWVYPSDSTQRIIASHGNAALPGTAWDFTRFSTGAVLFNCYDTVGSVIIGALQSPSITTNAWTHVALVRNGNSFVLYANGIGGSVLTSSSPLYDPSSAIDIGRLVGVGNAFNGYIDDFRITKGVARYTANFTPPTAPLPDI